MKRSSFALRVTCSLRMSGEIHQSAFSGEVFDGYWFADKRTF
jgi:hypothetical protein